MVWQVVGIGEVLWDMFPGGRKLGGAPANFAFHVRSILQDKVVSHVLSRVGDDDLGHEILSQLDHLGIGTNYVSIDSDHPTGTVDVEIDQQGLPTYIIKEGAAWDYISDEGQDLAGLVDAVCFGTLAQRSLQSRQAIQNFVRKTDVNALRVFDVNLRQHYYDLDVIEESLSLANVLKINDEELPIIGSLVGWSGKEDDMLKNCLERFDLQLGILTRGDKGSVLMNKDVTSVHQGITTKVIDSVGGGDSFTAAVIAGMLQGKDLDTINQYANKVGSFVCSQEGATPAIPPKLLHGF